MLMATKPDGTEQLVVTVQFKSQVMADSDEFLERDYLIRGKTRYLIRNEGDSIKLVVLLCSDSLSFKTSEFPEPATSAYLIVHLQLNPKPFHSKLKSYRHDLYLGGGEDYEVLCVNWVHGLAITVGDSEHAIQSNFGGSAHYMKSDEGRLSEDRVNRNHAQGLYYLYCRRQHFDMYCLEVPVKSGPVSELV